MDEPNNRIVIFKSVESLLNAHNKGKILLNANFIKDQINSFVKIKESIGRPNPNTILWNEEETEWIKTLEDLIFVLKYDLIELENIQVIFSVREKYDDCLIRYMEKLKGELQNKDQYIIATRILEERANLINLLPVLRYPSISIKYSLLRKAIHWLESNPQRQWETSLKIEEEYNPHPRIFTVANAFKLFNHLHEGINKNQIAEYSFVYWSMLKDGLIYKGVKPVEFIDWLNDNFEITLSEIKQYHNCNGGNKIPNYHTAKILYNC